MIAISRKTLWNWKYSSTYFNKMETGAINTFKMLSKALTRRQVSTADKAHIILLFCKWVSSTMLWNDRQLACLLVVAHLPTLSFIFYVLCQTDFWQWHRHQNTARNTRWDGGQSLVYSSLPGTRFGMHLVVHLSCISSNYINRVTLNGRNNNENIIFICVQKGCIRTILST